MEHKYSLPSAQVLTADPSPQPNESSPCLSPCLLKKYYNSGCLFPSDFPTKTLNSVLISSTSAIYATHFILLDLIFVITSDEVYISEKSLHVA